MHASKRARVMNQCVHHWTCAQISAWHRPALLARHPEHVCKNISRHHESSMCQRSCTLRYVNAPRITHALRVACAHGLVVMAYAPGLCASQCVWPRGQCAHDNACPSACKHSRARTRPTCARYTHRMRSWMHAKSIVTILENLLRFLTIRSSDHGGFERMITFRNVIKSHLC